MTIVKAVPYSWPHDAKLQPSKTAFIVIDMQVPPDPTLPTPCLVYRAHRGALDPMQLDLLPLDRWTSWVRAAT